MVPTFNSGKRLETVLSAVEMCFNVNRIVAVDKKSTDDTHQILSRHGAEVIEDEGSLGRARQLLIDCAQTDIFLMLDSDVVLQPGPWSVKLSSCSKVKGWVRLCSSRLWRSSPYASTSSSGGGSCRQSSDPFSRRWLHYSARTHLKELRSRKDSMVPKMST